MRVIIDIMSGDNAPEEILAGAAMAAAEFRASYILVGDAARIRETAAARDISLDRFEIAESASVIGMNDDPLCVVRAKNDSSMSVGLRMLSEDRGDVFISAGNTGALFTGATLIVRKIKGIQRAAIASILPMASPVLMLDAGANLTVTADHMEQFALMGSIYMKNIFGIERPRIGLLNNGTEESKGTQLQIESFAKLSAGALNFVGNIEANKIPHAPCDVLLTDGFTGNIVLKYTEGMGRMMFDVLRGLFKRNAVTKLSSLLYRDGLRKIKNEFDPSERGGAPFLGISRPVIKAHGSSDAKAIKNAVGAGIAYADTGLIYEISRETEPYRRGSGDNIK